MPSRRGLRPRAGVPIRGSPGTEAGISFIALGYLEVSGTMEISLQDLAHRHV